MNIVLLFPEDFAGEVHADLEGRRGQHLRKIKKVAPGDFVEAGIVNGKMAWARVKDLYGDEGVSLEVSLSGEPPPPLPVTLVIALPRPPCFRRILQTCATFGGKKVYFIGSQKAEKSYWESPALQELKVQGQLVEGLEQGRDTVLPEVHFRDRFRPFVEDELPELAKNQQGLLLRSEAGRRCPCRFSGQSVTFAVGPEGGFTEFEEGKLEEAGLEPVALGDRTLRVEHVVPALLGRVL